jgi:hypothetical protein
LSTQADYNGFTTCTFVSGFVDASGLAGVTAFASAATSIGGHSSTTSGVFDLRNNQVISSVNLGSLVTTSRSIFIINTSVGSINLNSLAQAGGALAFQINAGLQSLSLPSLASTGDSFNVDRMSSLTSFTAVNLNTVNGNFVVFNNPLLSNLDVRNLQVVIGDVSIQNNGFTTLSLPNLRDVYSQLVIANNPLLQSVSAPSLANLFGDVIFCANAPTFVLPSNVVALTSSLGDQFCFLVSGNAVCGEPDVCA